MRAEQLEGELASVARRYGSLFKQLGLDELGTQELASRIVAINFMRSEAIGAMRPAEIQVNKEGISFQTFYLTPDETQRVLMAYVGPFEAEIRNYLGDERYQVYNEFEESKYVLTPLLRLPVDLKSAGLPPLSDQQVTDLTHLLMPEPIPPTSQIRFRGDEGYTVMSAETMRAAGSILTVEQFALFEKFQEGQRKMKRLEEEAVSEKRASMKK
jgi:hypothetical protein